jgi:hypothetical protein
MPEGHDSTSPATGPTFWDDLKREFRLVLSDKGMWVFALLVIGGSMAPRFLLSYVR